MLFFSNVYIKVISKCPLNALDQYDAKKTHNNVCRKMYSFLKVTLRQSLKKSWLEEDKYMIFMIEKQNPVLTIQIKYPVTESQIESK